MITPIICFEPQPAPGLWAEPFVISVMEDDRECEYQDCQVPSRWFIEVAGYQGTGEPPYNCPTIYACDAHVVMSMEPLR